MNYRAPYTLSISLKQKGLERDYRQSIERFRLDRMRDVCKRSNCAGLHIEAPFSLESRCHSCSASVRPPNWDWNGSDELQIVTEKCIACRLQWRALWNTISIVTQLAFFIPRDHPRTRDYLGTAKSPYTRHFILRDMRIVSSLHAERDRSWSPKRTESHSFIFTSECWDDGSSPSRIRFTDACWRL